MPPKKSDLVHITFHFYKSAVLLSLPGSTSVDSLKSQLLPALKPFAPVLDTIPTKEDDINLYEDKEQVEGDEIQSELRSLEGETKIKSLAVLGWPRWKKVYVSFRGSDGKFAPPVYTIPSPEDGEDEAES